MGSHELVRTAPILQHEESPQEDRKLFQDLYHLHRESLLRLLYRFTGDWSSAEDSLQHAFATLYAKRREYDLALPLKNLLTTIALNHARLQHRSQAKGDRSGDPTAVPPAARDRQSRVEDLVRGLPSEERAIVVLRIYERASYQEIAEVLKIPLGTVKWKMHEAIRKLRPGLEAMSDEV
jgi:RNA polymerase sigma-70 factor, ECF subfamily